MMAKTWHYSVDGADAQTLDEKMFAEHCRTGKISDGTMVWTPGMDSWQSYADLRAADEAAEAVRKAARDKATASTGSQGTAVEKHTCAKCGKDWPTTFMTKAGARRLCRLCHSKEEEAAQSAAELKANQEEGRQMGLKAKVGVFLMCAVAVGAFLYSHLTAADKDVKAAKKPAAVGAAVPGSPGAQKPH